MKAELREILGQAVYNADAHAALSWRNLSEEVQELNRRRGEYAVKALATQIVPILNVLFTDKDIADLLEEVKS